MYYSSDVSCGFVEDSTRSARFRDDRSDLWVGIAAFGVPSEHRGGYAETAAALEPLVLGAIHHDDAVMVKGSLGSRMGPIVKALKRRYAPAEAESAPQG